MSRIYDALKKLEAERRGGGGDGNGHNGGNGHGNGHGNGNGNGNGKRNGNGRRRWRWPFNRAPRSHPEPRFALDFQLGPEVEEAYQRLGTNLLTAPGPDAGPMPRLLGVVASKHGEGTTTTVAVFASILVRRRSGRVAVVEANFRTPTFDAVFGVTRNGGFADVIQGQAELPAVVQSTQVPNLFVVTSGHATMGPSGLFDSAGLAPALAQLRESFDFVLFDLPPVNVYSDASILGSHLDAALVVIEADRTRVTEVERTRRTLERVGVRVVGSVLNRRRDYIPAFIEEML
jgi:capsular exopolysaccharide synthesis family protein